MNASVWTSAVFGSGLLMSLLAMQDHDPEPPMAPSAERCWARPVSTLTHRERIVTMKYRVATMAEHGAWLRRRHERRAQIAAMRDGLDVRSGGRPWVVDDDGNWHAVGAAE